MIFDFVLDIWGAIILCLTSPPHSPPPALLLHLPIRQSLAEGKQEDGCGCACVPSSPGPADTTLAEMECWLTVPCCRRIGWDFRSPLPPMNAFP